MISWFLGATVLNCIIVVLFINKLAKPGVLFRPEVLLPFVIGMIPTTLLGYFVGMFTCWPLVRTLCCRINGAPFHIGESVVIISGPHKGTAADVYETLKGQGGWNLLRLEIDQAKYTDIVEEYSVLRNNSL